MTRSKFVVLFALAATTLTAGLLASAQDPLPAGTPPPPVAGPANAGGTTITLRMPDGSVRSQVVLAMPAIRNLASFQGTAGNAARTLEQTLRRDLETSGIFRIQSGDELSVLTLTGDLAHDADQYRSLGAEMLLQNELKLEGDRLVLEGRLIDLASRQAIVGKRYRGTFDLARRIAHTFSDEIVLYLTGKRGVALTSIAFSSDRDGEKEIYLMDYDGFDQRRISGHRSISMSPAWSPGGDAIAYMSYFGGNGPAIYLADITTGKKSPLVTSGCPEHLAFVLARRQEGRLRARHGREHGHLLLSSRRQRAQATDHLAGHRHQPGVEPERLRDRLHLEPFGFAPDLRHGRRGLEPAPGHFRG
ncbi:MAG: hypothetical protein R2862_05235 [Thermoanaerobaculia bacterium]